MNRPHSIPQNYVFYKGAWCHPSRVPKVLRPCPEDRDDMYWREDEEASQTTPQTHAKAPPSDGNVSLAMENAKSCLASQKPSKRIKPLLNRLEQRRYTSLLSAGWMVRTQAITLRLDPPFQRYTPDLAYQRDNALVFVEVKGPHRFREKGIAKAALAAKTYPEFIFELHDWTGDEWKVTRLSP